MVEIEVKILNTYISILIDPGACRSYVSPKNVDVCKLGNFKHDKPWLVQLAIGMKEKFYETIKDYKENLNDFSTRLSPKILPLGSYDILIGVDLLEQKHIMLDCLHKSILCTDS